LRREALIFRLFARRDGPAKRRAHAARLQKPPARKRCAFARADRFSKPERSSRTGILKIEINE
jgi:hypothetical protein